MLVMHDSKPIVGAVDVHDCLHTHEVSLDRGWKNIPTGTGRGIVQWVPVKLEDLSAELKEKARTAIGKAERRGGLKEST